MTAATKPKIIGGSWLLWGCLSTELVEEEKQYRQIFHQIFRPLFSQLIHHVESKSVTRRLLASTHWPGMIRKHLRNPSSLISRHLNSTEPESDSLELVKLRQAAEASGEVIFLTDKQGIITYINPEFTRLYGYYPREVINHTTPRILKSGQLDQEAYEEFWRRLLKREIVRNKLVNRCRDGQLVMVESSANAILGDGGEIIGFLAIQKDITAREKADQELRERNRELAILNSIASTVNQSLDLEEILEGALDEVLKLNVVSQDAKGMIFLITEDKDLLYSAAQRGSPPNHPCLKQPIRIGDCLCGRAVQSGELTISLDGSEDPRHSRDWSPMTAHMDICLPLKARGDVLGVMNIRLPARCQIRSRDLELLAAISDQIAMAVENARLYSALSGQQNRLRALTIQISEMQEAERRRLARELHDQIGQSLSALGVNLNIIRSLLKQGAEDKIPATINDCMKLVDETSERVRDVMAELRPPILDDYGLVTALRWYGDQLSERTGIQVNVQSQQDQIRLNPKVEIGLFRIAQEALTNVVKHANATEVSISFICVANTIRFLIKDNGCGFDTRQIRLQHVGHGWGQAIMEERAEALGGTYRVESDPENGGTSVIVELGQ